MKVQDIREMGIEELVVKLEELEKQQFVLKSQAVTETIENSKSIRNIRRDIARVKTVINERNRTVKV